MLMVQDEAGNATNKTSLPWQITIYLCSGALAGINLSLMTRRTSSKKLDHFFRLLRTPVRSGEKVDTPCTLPEDHLPTETAKLIPLADVELPRPGLIGSAGFLVSWVLVAAIIWLTMFLAGLGA